MVAHLTGTRNRPLDVRRVPRTDACYLTQTLVRFSRQLLGPPTARHALHAVSLGDGNCVDHLILLEDTANLDRLLKQPLAEIYFFRNGATVDLDLHQMRLLLLERRLGDLCMCEHAHDRAVLLDALELARDGGAGRFAVLFGVLCEGLLFGLVPVLVETTLDLVAEMFSPYGREGAQTAWGLDVANEANDDHLQ